LISGKYIIGLTGQTGSGKTTAAGYFRKKGFAVIDCDLVAHEAITEPECLEKLEVEFGPEIILSDGSLDRRALGRIVFVDAEKLLKLNKITHPPIVEKILELSAQSCGHIIILDAPALIESGLYKNCDYIISIVADKHTRLKRIAKRDNLPLSEAEKRVNSQKCEDFYKSASDLVIQNDGIQTELIKKAEALTEYLRQKFAAKP
jgi:dephospho-CoA kinase